MQAFVNRLTNDKFDLKHDRIPHLLVDFIYLQIVKIIDKVNKIGRAFPYFTPLKTSTRWPMTARALSTWLPSLEKAGCCRLKLLDLPKEAFPMSSVSNPLAALPTTSSPRALKKGQDPLSGNEPPESGFDSGVSDVNVTNRLLLLLKISRPARHPPKKEAQKKKPSKVRLCCK